MGGEGAAAPAPGEEVRWRDVVAGISPCVICLDPPREDPVTTPCQHTYCRRCLQGLLRQHGSGAAGSPAACPLCRRDLAPFLRRPWGERLPASAPLAGLLAAGSPAPRAALRCRVCALGAEDAVVTPCCGVTACYWCLHDRVQAPAARAARALRTRQPTCPCCQAAFDPAAFFDVAGPNADLAAAASTAFGPVARRRPPAPPAPSIHEAAARRLATTYPLLHPSTIDGVLREHEHGQATAEAKARRILARLSAAVEREEADAEARRNREEAEAEATQQREEAEARRKQARQVKERARRDRFNARRMIRRRMEAEERRRAEARAEASRALDRARRDRYNERRRNARVPNTAAATNQCSLM